MHEFVKLNASNNSRKEKSLGLLCVKFLEHFQMYIASGEYPIVELDKMAKKLNVERRRIYDIVNVLESVELLSRVCKNQYRWHGFNNLSEFLTKLKTYAVLGGFLEFAKTLMDEFSTDINDDHKQAQNVYFEQRHLNHQTSHKRNAVVKSVSTQTISISRDEKSLGIMAQKFLMLFLTAEDGLVSINFAARVLLGDSKNDTTELGRFKTKIRRLYDIANVLSSLGIIEKYAPNDNSISKPAYRFIGPKVDIDRKLEYVKDFVNHDNPLSNSKHSLFDHFKRNLEPMSKIPKFDIHTGILTSKDRKRVSDVKPVLIPLKIKRETLEQFNSHSESEQSSQSPYATSSELSTITTATITTTTTTAAAYSILAQHQQQFESDVYLNDHLYQYQQQQQQDDYYQNLMMSQCYSNNAYDYETRYNNNNNSLENTTQYQNIDHHDQHQQEQASLPVQLADECHESYYQLTTVQSIHQQWNDNSSLVDSISPLASTHSTLPSFNTFLNA